MGISDEAIATVLIADYIAIDAANKINAIGTAFAMTGLLATGLTPQHHVAAIVDLPSHLAGREFALSVELHDDAAQQAVTMPGPNGAPEALRVQQVTKAERLQAPRGAYLPESMFCRVQIVLAFPGGLPLLPGRSYSWKLEIDGTHRSDWTARFYVLGPPPAPVFGGPAGATNIPTIQSL